MEEKEQMTALLAQLERNHRRQLWLMRLQCLFSGLFCAAVGWTVLRILPRIDSILVQTGTVLDNLEAVTGQLAGADLAGMLAEADGLVSTARTGLERLNTIDLETLSRAIEDLAAVVEPLSRISQLFS